MRKSTFSIFAPYKDNRTLAFNTYTHEFLSIELSLNSLNKLLSEHSPDIDVQKELIHKKFFVPDSYDEYSEFLYDYRSARYGPQWLVLYISPTIACNASCEYCFQRRIRAQKVKEKEPDYKELIKFVAIELPSAEGLKITWFGGEPLLKTNYIKKLSKNLIALCEKFKKSYSSSIVTNALLLNTVNADLLKDCMVDHVQVSLDGSEEIHNRIGRKDSLHDFSTIIQNINRLSDKIKVGIRINVSLKNISSIPDLLFQLSEDGIAKKNSVSIDFPLIYDFEIGNTENAYWSEKISIDRSRSFSKLQLKLYMLAKQVGFDIDPERILFSGSPQCHAIRDKGFSIWPNGVVTRCIHEITNNEEITIANTPNEIRNTQSQLPYVLKEIFNNELCKRCFYLPMCGGGCLHNRFHEIDPPASCPPSKFTIFERMRWYEAEKTGQDFLLDENIDTIYQDIQDWLRFENTSKKFFNE